MPTRARNGGGGVCQTHERPAQLAACRGRFPPPPPRGNEPVHSLQEARRPSEPVSRIKVIYKQAAVYF